MTVNQEMFRRIDELITEFPELHYQNQWETDPRYTGRCGTTRCVAGWAVWLKAKEMGLLSRKREMIDEDIMERLADELEVRADFSHVGAAVLGLDYEQAMSTDGFDTGADRNGLFFDYNHMRVRARVASFAETGEDISGEAYDSFN